MTPTRPGPWRPRHPAPIEFVVHARTLRAIAFRDAMRRLFHLPPAPATEEVRPPHDILL
jgi:hypothetical protein